MDRKRKVSGEALLDELRSEQCLQVQDVDTSTNATPQTLVEESRQPETQFATGDNSTPWSNENNSIHSTSAIQSQQEKKEGPLLIKLMDTTTKEITTRKIVANEIWHLPQNMKVIVELNGDGHGEDNGSNLLVRFLGKLAQNPALCPIQVESWHWMPKPKKVQLWKCVEDHFLFDYAVGCKWVMSTLGERWRAYKHQLRSKYFYPAKSKEELLANPPPEIDIADWTAFVQHYHGEKMKNASAQNTTNRKKLRVPHAGGSKSNARKACQMVKELGRPVCRGEVLLSNLVKRDGTYVNESRKTLADKISENLTQDQECAAVSGVPSKIYAQPDDSIGKVFGPEHYSRVRGLGIGVSPSTIFGLSRQISSSMNSNTSSSTINENHIEDLRSEVGALKEQLAGYEKTKEELSETKEELSQTKEELSRTQTQLSVLYKFMQDKFGFELPTIDRSQT